MDTKQCSKCNEVFQATEEFFHKEKNGYLGLRATCKSCRHEDNKKWRKDNCQYNLERMSKWRKDNPEYGKNWEKENRIRRRASKAERFKKNPAKKIAANLSGRLYHVIIGRKSTSTMNLIGCSINELKQHLEKQFTEGMTWENYGKWHVDHIRPCSSFDFSDPKQQRECFNYKNLQPLWAIDNLRKGKKFVGEIY